MRKINFNKLEEILDREEQKNVDTCHILGCNLAVYQQDVGEIKKCYGYSDVDSNRKMGTNSLFRLASMTKPITAVAILREIEKGNVDLFDYIDTFIPEFANLEIANFVDNKVEIIGKATNRPRVLHLLTHTSGIGTDKMGFYCRDFMKKEDMKNLESVVLFHAKQPISFEPYSQSFYSALAAFEILGRIVEIVSEKSFDKYIKEEIFDPIGMCDTAFQPSEEQLSRLVDMHMVIDGKNVKRNMYPGCSFENVPDTIFSGGAGLYSTLDDYFKFGKMFLNDGMAGGARIISKKTIKSLSIPHVPDNILCGEHWSLGMRCIADKEYKKLEVGSFGWSGAYGTHFWVDPVNRITAVYMKNSAYDGGAGAKTSADFERYVFESLE